LPQYLTVLFQITKGEILFKAKISGIGKYVPPKILTNHDLEKLVETNDEWITSRTGIKERHIAGEGETSSTMGAKAAEKAIEMAGISKDEIEMIIFCTITPDMVFPASACLVQDLLKIPNTGTVDIEAACSGFIYGLSMANAYIASGMYKNILVIGAETLSRITDWQDRNTCVLFGDGAGAAVVSRADESDKSGILGFKLYGNGAYKDLLYVEAGGSFKPATHETVDQRLHFVKMNGNSTFKLAVRTMSDELEELLRQFEINAEDIKCLIPHQANLRIINGVADRLHFPIEKVFINLHKYGNTSSATIPIALAEAVEENKIKKGDLIAFVAFGGGFTSGACVLRL
jgi:3-oxoacyl-[acyl-carrier-protein] synthase III